MCRAAWNRSASIRIVVARSYRSWCGHRSVTFVERLTAAEAEVRRPDILVAKLVDDLKRHDKCSADIYDRRHDEKRIRPETVRPVVD